MIIDVSQEFIGYINGVSICDTQVFDITKNILEEFESVFDVQVDDEILTQYIVNSLLEELDSMYPNIYKLEEEFFAAINRCSNVESINDVVLESDYLAGPALDSINKYIQIRHVKTADRT